LALRQTQNNSFEVARSVSAKNWMSVGTGKSMLFFNDETDQTKKPRRGAFLFDLGENRSEINSLALLLQQRLEETVAQAFSFREWVFIALGWP
jgi:hypothetical protein